jgi:hypothetical protein
MRNILKRYLTTLIVDILNTSEFRDKVGSEYKKACRPRIIPTYKSIDLTEGQIIPDTPKSKREVPVIPILISPSEFILIQKFANILNRQPVFKNCTKESDRERWKKLAERIQEDKDKYFNNFK